MNYKIIIATLILQSSISMANDATIWISNADFQHIEISMTNSADIYGFQVHIVPETQLLISDLDYLQSGLCQEYGLEVIVNQYGLILAFSITGQYIPSESNGVLVAIGWALGGTSGYIDLDVINFSDEFGNPLAIELGDPYYIEVYAYGCTDPLAVNYNPEAILDDGSCYYIDDISPHFNLIWSGWSEQPVNAMGVIINSAVIDGESLRIGDEIAVFDGDICVGWHQLVSEFDNYILLIVSEDNPETPEIDGFQTGSEIKYRFWDADNQIELVNIDSELLAGYPEFTPFYSSFVDLSVESLFGCANPDACNFNSEATIEDGSCEFLDCTGDCGGTAFLDDCGICTLLGDVEYNICNGVMDGDFCIGEFIGYAFDCNGECFGSASLDDCDICSGGYSGHEANSDMDECGICYGQNYYSEESGTIIGPDADCMGVCFGAAYIDLCDECVDDPQNDNQCIGCMDPYAINYDPGATIDNGSCFYEGEGDFNGDGEVNVSDVIIIIEIIFNAPPYDPIFDLYYDGYINVMDVIAVVQMILWLEE